ncbi:hypothetical protein N658DRAFT_90630 [Parathielavia hyrcaniae]|uniref:Uncharacterized protein n=1 Tax=Parathielavia hyrcaniae TaxID=113614 RepID=A0AAN6T1H1_9PEZI|nr:hypothetical protein N658DRAFT_90630 [Parathielavia hyrcaniae]
MTGGPCCQFKTPHRCTVYTEGLLARGRVNTKEDWGLAGRFCSLCTTKTVAPTRKSTPDRQWMTVVDPAPVISLELPACIYSTNSSSGQEHNDGMDDQEYAGLAPSSSLPDHYNIRVCWLSERTKLKHLSPFEFCVVSSLLGIPWSICLENLGSRYEHANLETRHPGYASP